MEFQAWSVSLGISFEYFQPRNVRSGSLIWDLLLGAFRRASEAGRTGLLFGWGPAGGSRPKLHMNTSPTNGPGKPRGVVTTWPKTVFPRLWFLKGEERI